MSNLINFELSTEKSLKNQKINEIINKDKINKIKKIENIEKNLDCTNDYFVENDSKDFSDDEDRSMTRKKQKNVDISEEYIGNKEVAVPVRRNTKTYTTDKIKLMSESQRLLRGCESGAIKYKPKQYKTINDFKKAIEKNYENERNKKCVTENGDDGKENVNENIKDKDTAACSDSLKLKDRLKLSDEVKLNSQPKTIDYNSQLENILKMKYQNRSGYIELKTKEEYQRDKVKSQNILNILKKTLNHVAVMDDNSFTELNTIIKSVDPVTGQEVLKKKIVSVQKGQSANYRPILKGIDPVVEKQIQSKLSEEDLIKFKMMSAAEKFSYHRNMLLKESNDKRSKLRDMRIKDMPATFNVELNKKKQNSNDLSDDDYEWTADNEEDNENDSNSDSASDGTNYNNEDSDEEFGIKKKINKQIRVGIIDDDEEDDFKDDRNDKDILSFVDDTGVSNGNECDVSKLFTGKELAQVISPTGVRNLTRYELSPKIEINKKLQNISLPNEAVSIIKSLKKKFGLVNKLFSGDSSVLLLPTMKTTTTAIETLLKNHILIQGTLNPDILQDFKDMLSDEEVQIHTTWKDDFNLLSSIKRDDHNLASYSFLNNSFFSTKSLVSGHDNLSLNLDDTFVMKSTVIPEVAEPLQETILLDVDESSSSTIILNSEDNSVNEGTSNSAALNNYHAQLFKFSDNMTQLLETSTEVVQNNISSIEDSRNKNYEKNITEDLKDHHSEANDVCLGDNEDGEKNVSVDSKEFKDVCDNDMEDVDLNDGDIDDVDLDDGDVDDVDLEESDAEDIHSEDSDAEDIHSEDSDSNDDADINLNSRNMEDNVDLDDSDHEMNKENINYDGDEEEILRKHVKSGYKFVPTDYIDEEAELSGSDAEEYGPDEDEQDLDRYEDEEGDTDKLPSEGKLRRQIERIHHKLEVDKDAHDIRYIKEMYLEDGDIDIGEDGPRKKQFNWDNMNYNDVPIRIATSDDESEEDCESPERTNTLVVEEEEKDYVEEEGLLLKKYVKFIDNKCSVTNESEEVLRPAWTTDIITESKPPSIKKCGSMMNKQMNPLYFKKSDSSTKTALNDFDLKTRMSVMFTTPKRPSDTILKRGASILPALSLKRQRTNDEK